MGWYYGIVCAALWGAAGLTAGAQLHDQIGWRGWLAEKFSSDSAVVAVAFLVVLGAGALVAINAGFDTSNWATADASTVGVALLRGRVARTSRDLRRCRVHDEGHNMG